jgi:hypothetical protein
MDVMQMTGLLFGFGLLGYGAFRLFRRFMLSKRCSAQADGTIVDISARVIDITESVTDEGNKNYYVKYTYTVDSVPYSSITPAMAKSTCDKLNDSDYITVWYDPAEPKRHYIPEFKGGMIVPICCAVGGLIFLYEIYLIYWA